MNDLPDLLDDASQPEGDWLADPHALLAEGRHRVRRRRLTYVAGAAAAMVLVVSASAIVAPQLTSDPEPAKPKDKHSSLYVAERLSPDEVERRCRPYLDNQNVAGSARPWVAGVSADGRAVPASESTKPIENRVGQRVAMAREGDPLDLEDPGIDCAIPQAAFVDVAGLPIGDPPRSRAAFGTTCSQILGYDVAGWQQAAVAKDSEQWLAVFVSANGYAAECATDLAGGDQETWMYDRRFYDDDGRPIMLAEDQSPNDVNRYLQLTPDCQVSLDNPRWTDCRAAGMLSSTDPDVTVELTLPDGRVERIAAVRGGFAYSFRFRTADVPTDIQVFPTRILDADGKLIWEGWQQ